MKVQYLNVFYYDSINDLYYFLTDHIRFLDVSTISFSTDIEKRCLILSDRLDSVAADFQEKYPDYDLYAMDHSTFYNTFCKDSSVK